MKVLVQRVKEAEVKVKENSIGKIKAGMLLFVGFTLGDNEEKCKKMAEKIGALRIFSDSLDKMNLNIKDIKGEILSVSQFTLYADTQKGNRPSFVNSLEKNEAKRLYEKFNENLEELLEVRINEGIFGASMAVSLINDGPVTIILES